MEIIIHGKPNAGSHNLTAGIDRDFAEKIVDDFFQQSGSIKFGNCLITDARFWKGKWYFTYTYFVNSNLRGVGQDARATFFALTIVEQSRYYCLVSEIYTKLKEIYNTYIAGRYIRDGQYIVQDFADTQLFNGLTIQLNGLVNLTEPVDAGFKQCADLKFDERYNIVDCDAKAFVQSLRESGRVVVSETFPSKDEKLAGIKSIQQKLEIASFDLKNKDEQIKQLENRINSINIEGGRKKDEIQKLQGKIDELNSQNLNLSSSVSQLNNTIELYKSKLEKIASISGVPAPNEEESKPTPRKSKHRNVWLLINTILLIIIIMLLLVFNNTRSARTSLQSEESSIENSKTDNSEITAQPRNRDENFQQEDTNVGRDEDCGFTVLAENGSPLRSGDNIAAGTKIKVIVQETKGNYSIKTDNLKNGDQLKLDEPFEVHANNNADPIMITYRSEDRRNLNEENKIELKIN